MTMEQVRPGASAAKAKVAFFDFDGTLSLVRSGWMDVMVPMMVEILGGLKTGETDADLKAVVEDFVWRLTGKETIYQMIEFAANVDKRGGQAWIRWNIRRCIWICSGSASGGAWRS